MEALADAVGLRALGFGTRVVDILHRYVELVSEYCGNPERHRRPSAEPVDDLGYGRTPRSKHFLEHPQEYWHHSGGH